MANGSLHRYIHHGDGKSKAPMPPGERVRIAPESAQALTYMHSSASPPILHGELKSANILLDVRRAHTDNVSDFRAPRLAPVDEAQVTR
jgi:serine/threonine protein kinase